MERIAEALDADPAINHVAMVYSETTSGLLNDIEEVGALCHERGLTFIVDAMSSFACVDIPVETFKAAGVEPTMAETREPMGMLKIDHIRTMLKMPRIEAEWVRVHGAAPTEDDVQALYAPYEERLLSILHDFAAPKPGTIECVARLREAGVKIGTTTGYNDKMMEIVVPAAREAGYDPDFVITPDGVGGHGRPYPYMVFRNLEALGVRDVRNVVKVGDTVSDIREGLCAGVRSIGVAEGSSVMGLTQAEYEALDSAGQDAACERAARVLREAGAADVVRNLSELPGLLGL